MIQALLAKGANPNIVAMGFTPFLLSAGVDPGGRGGGGAANTGLMDLDDPARRGRECPGHRYEDILHADLLPPSSERRHSALHAAAETGRVDMVRYLLDKGANPEISLTPTARSRSI